VSGLYVLKFARDDRFTSFAPIVITDTRPADLLMQASVTTYEAYNGFQGESLYEDVSGRFALGLALQVSFDRPYATDRGTGQLLRYEALFAGFLEQYGYDVTYTTNVDVNAGGLSLVADHGAWLTVGHDEYWSGSERDAIEGARDHGVPVLFFAADTGYWKIRFEPSADPTNPRVFTCYKADPLQDPVQGAEATGLFRAPPINRPENELIGTTYESYELTSGAWTVADAASFLYAGTGLHAGDQLPLLVGYEYDVTANNGVEPPVDVVARSPVINAYGMPSWSDATTYRSSSGALVFSAGSIEWSYGLGQPGIADPRVARMTANVLKEALALPIPSALATVQAPVPPVIDRTGAASDVQQVAHGFAGPTAVAARPDGTFYVVDAQSSEILLAGPDDTVAPTVLAGDGIASSKAEYDNVPGLQARFDHPTGIALLPNGDVIVADTLNNCLRRMTSDPMHLVSTFAGLMGVSGSADGVAAVARFDSPEGLAVDPTTGDILVADMGNHRIRRVNATDGSVTTVAGSTSGDADGPALSAQIGAPTALAAAADGRIFVVESSDHRVLVIGTDPARTVTTIAGGSPGSSDGSGSTATLAVQGGILWDGTVLYVSEPSLNRIRRIVPGATAMSTQVETWVGFNGFGQTDGPAAFAQLAGPTGLAFGPGRSILEVDSALGLVRLVSP
jgi:DNA-binding beta-propeller fold protein YncE